MSIAVTRPIDCSVRCLATSKHHWWIKVKIEKAGLIQLVYYIQIKNMMIFCEKCN